MITGEGQDALFLLEKSVARWTGHRNPAVRVDAERKCLLIEIPSYINRIFTGFGCSLQFSARCGVLQVLSKVMVLRSGGELNKGAFSARRA